MKKILCFGDSNTYGYNPLNASRYEKKKRWSGILSEKFTIIEAGCNNRTGFFNNPSGIEQTGYKIFPQLITKYNPSTVIIAIGINDLQFQYNATFQDIETGLKNLIYLAKEKEIILVSPSIIGENVLNSFFSSMFDKTSIEKSKKIPIIYKKIAHELNCKFIDLNNFTTTSEIDGLHYSSEEHYKIAKELIKVL